ncbi:MAG: Ig-like domain-containing protein, partial [Chlamydiia bacterium]|nr:Ig-like domain-containing protein [Chlamydiia bacterium]
MKKNYMKLLMLFTLMFATSVMMATNVTLKVIDSDGNPISGVSISIHKSNSGGLPAITTNASGEATVDLANYYLTYVFTAALDHSRSAYSQVITSADAGNLIHTFQTAEAKIQATDCNGTPLAGVAMSYFISNSGGGSLGTTGASGIVTKELFTGTYSFKAVINKTRKSVNVDISATGVDYTFMPTQVNLTYSSAITVWQNNIGGITVTPGTYMFPGTYNFKFGNAYTAALTVGDCSSPQLSGSVNILKVKDHNGNPIAGAKFRGGYGSSYGSWHVSGSTNADGVLMDIRTANTSGFSYEARVNNTTATLGPLTTGYYEFQTQQIAMRIETCGGAPLEGGHIRWGHGASFGSYHFAGGNTNSNGESYLEMFPGTYSFEMALNSTTQVKASYSFPSDGTTVTWKTTKVILNYSGSISYGGSLGNSHWFVKPSMEMLPGGTHLFNFKPNNVMSITITDCSNGPIEVNAAFIRLEDSQGNGLQGGIAKYYKSGWQNAGVTDANGNIFLTTPGLTGNIPFRMHWKGGSVQKSQNLSTNSTVLFQTELVTAELNKSDDTDLNATFKYYASGWKVFGSGTASAMASMELLGRSYPFRVY